MHGGRELVFEGTLENDRANGVASENARRAKRQAGQWAGGDGAQGEGLTQQGLPQQVKGKAQKAWGDLKDAVRFAKNRGAKNQASSRAEKRPAATRLTKA
jgi:uncharacterized protein YjbJ (UPF0337 family)